MQKARSVIPNMCWYLAKALLPIGKKTRAMENVPLARRVSARTPSTTEIPREDNGTRDGRMDSHGHPNGGRCSREGIQGFLETAEGGGYRRRCCRRKGPTSSLITSSNAEFPD